MRAHIADFPACPHCADFSKDAPCVARNFGYPERCLRRHTSFVGQNVLVLIGVVIIFIIAALFTYASAAEPGKTIYQSPDEDVRVMRRSPSSQAVLADRFHLSIRQVRNIQTRHSWGHVR